MKKPTKLNLNDLKVDSFVTSLDGKDSQTVKAGSSPLCVDVAVSLVVVSVASAVVYGLVVATNAIDVARGVVEPPKTSKKK